MAQTLCDEIRSKEKTRLVEPILRRGREGNPSIQPTKSQESSLQAPPPPPSSPLIDERLLYISYIARHSNNYAKEDSPKRSAVPWQLVFKPGSKFTHTHTHTHTHTCSHAHTHCTPHIYKHGVLQVDCTLFCEMFI